MLSLIAPALSAQDKEKSVERKNAQQEYDALAKKYQDAEPAFQTLGLIKVDNMARLRASVSATQFGRLLADPDFRPLLDDLLTKLDKGRDEILITVAATCLIAAQISKGADKTAAERGSQAVYRVESTPPVLSRQAYDNAWKQWGVPEKPSDYGRAFQQRYGLHPAPYENHGLPMGLHEARGILGRGVTNDCLLCHAGSVAGRTYIGLPNTTLDLQSLFEELAAAGGFRGPMPLRLSNVRGTTEAAAATFYLLTIRNPDLTLSPGRIIENAARKTGYRDDLCEDMPAWWLLKKKKTMYHTGDTSARSVRSMMPFLLSPLHSADYIQAQEPVFADIQAYLLTL
jgi:hypothetical protein